MQNYYNYVGMMKDMEAKSTMDVGSREIRDLKVKGRNFAETQRAVMAANGISGVTADDILSDTAYKTALDAETIAYNAKQKAWESTEEGRMDRISGKNAAAKGWGNALNTLIGTAGQVYDSWYKWKQTGAGKTNNSSGVPVGATTGISTGLSW